MDRSVQAVGTFCTPVAFAYPDGAFDGRVLEQVQRAGVSSAVTCEPGIIARGTDPMRLPRWFVIPAARL